MKYEIENEPKSQLNQIQFIWKDHLTTVNQSLRDSKYLQQNELLY